MNNPQESVVDKPHIGWGVSLHHGVYLLVLIGLWKQLVVVPLLLSGVAAWVLVRDSKTYHVRFPLPVAITATVTLNLATVWLFCDLLGPDWSATEDLLFALCFCAYGLYLWFQFDDPSGRL